MAAIPTLENRIVNIKQTTADGVVSIQEAELRHICRGILVKVNLQLKWEELVGSLILTIQLLYPAVGMELVLGQGAREASVHLSD